MESNWRLNAWRYGLIGRLDFIAQASGIKQVLYALSEDGLSLYTNARNPLSPAQALRFQVVSDERVLFEPVSAGFILPPRPFPYGFAVEPDSPS